MMTLAPLRVPVEIRLDHDETGIAPRWFRLAIQVSEAGLALLGPLPDALAGDARALRVCFHLPEDPEPIVCGARAQPPERRGDDASGDGAPVGPRQLRFIDLAGSDRLRVARYVEERVPA